MADTGLHFHALARFLLRLLLLLLLAGVLRVGLTFLQRLSQILCSLVGLAIVVHRHLRAALVGRSNLLCIVRVRVVAVRASLLRVELDIHRGMEALLVGHVLQLHGLARHIVGFLLFGEVHAAPFADGADAAVLVRPRVAALLLLGLVGIFPALRLTFEKGELKAVNDETFDDPIKAIQKVEEIGAAYGIGRDMHVGDTIIGIKGRVGFEAAAPMLIIGAHKFLEKYTLSKWQQYWKDQVANWYGMFLHESQYLEPVMRDIEAMLESSQRNVNGTAILELHPLCFSTVGVESKDDLVKNKFGEYGEMQKGWTAEDAKGFIKVTSTALRAYYSNHKDEKI